MKSKILRFLLSLVIAFGIWLFVVSVVSPESETIIQGIPVILDGENILADRDLIIVSDKNFTVDLKLFGNRVDLKKLSASNITLLADLSQITTPGEHNIRYAIVYPAIIKDGNVDALERNPQHITLTIAERGWKDVPVKVKYTGSVSTNYVADRQNPQFDHAMITVSGPVEELEKVDHASISVDLNGKVETIVGSFRPTLCTANGTPLNDTSKLTMNVNEVRATIKIHKIKKVPLVLEVIPGGGLTENDVKLTPTLESIVVSGSDSVLENLDKLVVGQIHLAELMESTDLSFAITMPAGISNVTGVTELGVNVELLKQLDTYEFTLTRTQINLVNVPGNRHVKVLTEAIKVTIRGTKEEIEWLKQNPDKIVALVDCGDVQDVTNQNAVLNVTIQITGDSGAGAVGEYQVVVEVTEVNTGG